MSSIPDQRLSQATYRPTEYEDASWELLGDRFDAETFTPLEIPVLPSAEAFVDPMFADYGGRIGADVTERWHLPDGVSFRAPSSEAATTEIQEEGRISLTEEELEAIKSSAFAEGQQAGLEAAVERNTQKLAGAEENMRQVIGDMHKQVTELVRRIESQAAQLSIQIAKKLVENAVEINPEYIVGLVREAIEASGSASIRTIKVSPEDFEFIKLVGLDKDFRKQDDSWEFVGDSSVKAGCIVETSAGEVDFQLDRAFERIRDKLMRLQR